MTKQLIDNIIIELQQKIYLSGESCGIAKEILEKHLSLPQEPTQEQEEKIEKIGITDSDIERIMLELDEAKEQIKRYLKIGQMNIK